MQRKYLNAAALAAMWIAAPAWAINKCTGPDGKVSYQEQPCAGQGGELKIRPQGNPTPTPAPAKTASPVAGSASTAPAAPVTPQHAQAPKSELQMQADQCLAYYKPKLRDPSGAYHTDVQMDKTVLSLKMHATNGFGGYVTREVSCEFKQNGELDADWTKVHAQRIGW
ncbi:MAG: hypothetical protein RSG22_04430 [Comamonas sp.]